MPTYNSLSDQQLLEALLKHTTNQEYDLDKTFDQERNLLSLMSTTTHDHEFLKTDHSQKTWDLIKAIYYRTNQESLPDLGTLINPENVYGEVKQFFHGLHEEKMLIIASDSQCHILEKFVVNGAHNAALLDIQQVVRWALESHAEGLLLAHNHPNRVVEPSKYDIETCQQLQKALKLIDVQLFDSIVVSDDDFYSMAKNKDIE